MLHEVYRLIRILPGALLFAGQSSLSGQFAHIARYPSRRGPREAAWTTLASISRDNA